MTKYIFSKDTEDVLFSFPQSSSSHVQWRFTLLLEVLQVGNRMTEWNCGELQKRAQNHMRHGPDETTSTSTTTLASKKFTVDSV